MSPRQGVPYARFLGRFHTSRPVLDRMGFESMGDSYARTITRRLRARRRNERGSMAFVLDSGQTFCSSPLNFGTFDRETDGTMLAKRATHGRGDPSRPESEAMQKTARRMATFAMSLGVAATPVVA